MKQKYIRNLLFLLVLSNTALLAEPSVYGFNNSNDRSTSSGSMDDQNKRSIDSLRRQISEQNERIDGLTSLIEGISATLGELQGGGTGLSTGSGNDNTALLKELGGMIDNINNNYVSKEELNKILNSKGTYSTSSQERVPQRQGQKTIPKESLEEKPASELYSEGVRFFVKNRYSDAKDRFTITDIKGYKPAASNYYLGEISYYTKNYEDAIFYFKKSAGLHDQASYIDVLLLHTAISLERSGDKAQARVFYENIIENYQGKKSAQIAKDQLSKM